MAELHWHAATSAGSADGTALIGQGRVHLAADLPVGTLQNAVATLPWPMADDERLFMNGYQTWTECPELGKRDRQRGTDVHRQATHDEQDGRRQTTIERGRHDCAA